MTAELSWRESLDGPRSLGTGADIAVVALEDPGVIELGLYPGAESHHASLEQKLGLALPQTPWSVSTAGSRTAIWVAPRRWRLLVPRAEAPALAAELTSGDAGLAVDETGALTALRLVGAVGHEALARTCAQDIFGIAKGSARGTLLAQVPTLIVHEDLATDCWLILVPRSRSLHVARALVDAAQAPDRLELFRKACPPPV